MRTNIVIRDNLMSQALRVTGYKTKREIVAAGLDLSVKMASQQKIHTARGKIYWDSDLDRMRRDA